MANLVCRWNLVRHAIRRRDDKVGRLSLLYETLMFSLPFKVAVKVMQRSLNACQTAQVLFWGAKI